MIRIDGTAFGMQADFVPDGTSFGEPAQTSGPLVLPPIRTDVEGDESPFTPVGKVNTGQPAYDRQTYEAMGFSTSRDDSKKHNYEYQKKENATYKYLNITSQYISDEVLKLSYLPLVKGDDIFINGWLNVRVLNALAPEGQQVVATFTVYGRLSMTQLLNSENNVVNAQMRFDIDANPLADVDLPIIPTA